MAKSNVDIRSGDIAFWNASGVMKRAKIKTAYFDGVAWDFVLEKDIEAFKVPDHLVEPIDYWVQRLFIPLGFKKLRGVRIWQDINGDPFVKNVPLKLVRENENLREDLRQAKLTEINLRRKLYEHTDQDLEMKRMQRFSGHVEKMRRGLFSWLEPNDYKPRDKRDKRGERR